MHETAQAHHESIAFAIIWLIGALASLVGTINDPNYRFGWRLLGAVGCGGFLATAACGLLGESASSLAASGGYPSGTSIGLASLFGLLGKHSDQVLRFIANRYSGGKLELKKDDDTK